MTTRAAYMASAANFIPQFTGANKFINGHCVLDQQNAGTVVTPTTAGSGDTYIIDGWRCSVSANGKLQAGQNLGSVTPPAGFTNYLGFKVTTAYVTGATDYFKFDTCIEGFDIADLNWGTPNASPVTISAIVYSSVTGTFGGAVRNGNGTRSYPFTYQIPTANSFNLISVMIPGDTGGTWTADNSIGASIEFGLGVGATYSGPAGAWASANYVGATGAANIINTLNAVFYVTGLKFEKGAELTPFVADSYGINQLRCFRYYWKTPKRTVFVFYSGIGMLTAPTAGLWMISAPVTMRAPPVVGQTGSIQVNVGATGWGIANFGLQSSMVGPDFTMLLNLVSSPNFSAGATFFIQEGNPTGGSLTFDARF